MRKPAQARLQRFSYYHSYAAFSRTEMEQRGIEVAWLDGSHSSLAEIFSL